MEGGCRGRSRLALRRQHTLTLVYALFSISAAGAGAQPPAWADTLTPAAFSGARMGCDLAFKVRGSDLLPRGATAQEGDAQKAAGGTPAAHPRRSAPNASQNELPKHPASSSNTTRATQNLVHCPGASPAQALGSSPPYYRRQSLDASLPLHPLPAAHPAGRRENILQGSRLRQTREEKKKKKSMTAISLVSLPDVAFVGAERFSSISMAARMGGMLGDLGVRGKRGTHGPCKHNPRA